MSQAQGDAQRFRSVLTEYQKAPQVTRDRMYLDTMQQIYANVTKVMVDSRQGSNLLYMPLDKLMQGSMPAPAVAESPVPTPPATGAVASGSGNDARTRDTSRSRDRDNR